MLCAEQILMQPHLAHTIVIYWIVLDLNIGRGLALCPALPFPEDIVYPYFMGPSSLLVSVGSLRCFTPSLCLSEHHVMSTLLVR